MKRPCARIRIPESARSALLVIAGLALLFLLPAPARADDRLDEYFRGLRQRRLYSVAETQCLRRLADPDLPSDDQARLTIELSRTYAGRASTQTGAARDEQWQRARSVIDEFVADHPRHRLRPWLDLQAATIPADQGALLAWQAQLLQDQNLKDQAATALREALARLSALAKTLETLRTRNDGDRLPRDEQQRLEAELSIRRAQVAVDLASVLSPGTERTAALEQARRLIDGVEGPFVPPRLTWQGRLLRLRVARLQHDQRDFESGISAIRAAGPGLAVQRQVAAERARFHLDENKPDEALTALLEHRNETGSLDDELRCLQVEALLQAAFVARSRDRMEFAGELEENARAIASVLQGAWKARAQTLLNIAGEQEDYGPELAGLVRSARQAYQAGQIDEAIDAFEQAAVAAVGLGRRDVAIDLAFTRASLQMQQEDYAAAAASLQELVEQTEGGPRQAEMDLLRTYCLGRLYQQQPTARRREAYSLSLADHRKTFAASPTAGEASWMLAQFEEYRQQWTRALELYSAIPRDHERGPAAAVRMAAMYEKILQRVVDVGQPIRPWLVTARDELQQVIDQFPPAPQRLTTDQADVAVRLARMLIAYGDVYAPADQLLERVLNTADIERREAQRDERAPDPRWIELHGEAAPLRIVSLAAQGRLPDAALILNDLSAANPQALLQLLAGLARLESQIPSGQRQALGRLQLQAADRLAARANQLTDPQQTLLKRCRADAHALAGQLPEAIALYEELLARFPNNRELLKLLSDLLMRQSSSDSIARALQLWRQLERMSRKGTQPWLEARFHVAECLYELGRYDECRKLIGVTRVVYPELGGNELKQRYKDLEAKVTAK
ncbi:tetratricopeptide repeat protein [Maioricimonas sp. JC845]|uniref:tetratricopeptide repeat protein n=1 Tax=Maioricimonas sp. JC845 TaxID=3232138 RepID=UPI0034580758